MSEKDAAAINRALELLKKVRARELRRLTEEYGRPAAKAIQKLERYANNQNNSVINCARAHEKIERIKRKHSDDGYEIGPKRRRYLRREIDHDLIR